jgi:Galactose oxidase, central domain
MQAVLFGGCGGEQAAINCLNDVWAFDLELHRWDKVADSDNCVSARASFGMCAGTHNRKSTISLHHACTLFIDLTITALSQANATYY